MIKCLECGFESERLQWTHFKYKCTGRFANGTEYKKAYPNAMTVSPEMAKKTAVTLVNLVAKYGEEEGKLRWNAYCDKQAESNKFDYKQKKYGWTKEQFDEYNSSRAQTLEKMIARHGETEGSRRWLEYCDKQAYTNTLRYFIEKYGYAAGLKKYKEVNKGKAKTLNPKLLAENLGIAIEDAIEIILTRGSNNGATWGSKLEKEFTEQLEDSLGEKLEYTTFSKPYGKWSHENQTYVIYDIKHKDCIIEFNGDYWHANPKIYKDDALIRGMPAHRIQEKDLIKIKLAESLGFRTYTVWESDFKKNKTHIINEVIKWMQNGQK